MAEPDPGSMQMGPSAPQGMFCEANALVCSPQQHSKSRVQSWFRQCGVSCLLKLVLQQCDEVPCGLLRLVCLNCRPGSHLVIGCQDCNGSP